MRLRSRFPIRFYQLTTRHKSFDYLHIGLTDSPDFSGFQSAAFYRNGRQIEIRRRIVYSVMAHFRTRLGRITVHKRSQHAPTDLGMWTQKPAIAEHRFGPRESQLLLITCIFTAFDGNCVGHSANRST